MLVFIPQLSGLEGYCHGPGWCPGDRAGGYQTCGTHISLTASHIFSVRSPLELTRPVGVYYHSHLPIFADLWHVVPFMISGSEIHREFPRKDVLEEERIHAERHVQAKFQVHREI